MHACTHALCKVGSSWGGVLWGALEQISDYFHQAHISIPRYANMFYVGEHKEHNLLKA